MVSSKEKALSYELFNEISPTYDFVNRMLSLGLDLYWRRKVASFLPKGKPIRLLDGATGTGDLLFSLLDKHTAIEEAVGLDLASHMLSIARKKIEHKPYKYKVTFKEGSLLDIPYPKESFSCVTISFGIRNVEHLDKALQEVRRVLKPGGKALILEFSLPRATWMKKGYLWYLQKVLPKLGKLLSGHPTAYTYLQETISSFPYGKAFCHHLEQAGFSHSQAIPIHFGIVTLYEATV